MSSFFEDLKLLHPHLELPSGSGSSSWKEKLVDSTISPDEWSAHAKDFLREVGGADYHLLLAETGPATPDHNGVFGSAIIGYLLKDIKESLLRSPDKIYIKSFFMCIESVKEICDRRMSGWQEICEWPTETRYSRYDRFLDFVATLCFNYTPEEAKKGRDMLACATLIEVHYLMRLLYHSSKTYKSHKQNEDGGKTQEVKHILDISFDIYLRCDPALYTLNEYNEDWPLCCSSLKSRLNVAIYDAAKRYNIMPTHMHVKGVVKIGRDPVGSGGFADVWKGMANGTVVALKVPRLHCEGVDLKIVEAQTCKEGFIWNRLSHENILPLLGFYSAGNDPFIMVSPWMDNGNLTTYLRHNESANRQELMYGVYRGLCYLHSRNPPIAHGDLRCANILVDNLGKPLISDFGLSRVQDLQLSLPTGYTSGVSGGSYRWQAPELWWGTGKHTASTDVYAYAMTCLEVYSGKKPLENYSEAQLISKFASGVVLEIPESIKTSNSRVAQGREVWWQDLTRCCSADATHRPSTFETIRMVCVLNSGLWQPNACDSETDYDDLHAIRAHESCLPSECLWTLKGLPFSTKNNTIASRQIADLSVDVIHLRNVEITPHKDYYDGRLDGVCEGKMEGIFVNLRLPKFSTIVGCGHQADTRLKAFNNTIKDSCRVWGSLRHRNILPLLGISMQNGPYIHLVTPSIQVSDGHYPSTLAKHIGTISDPYQILYGVYDGLCYLHSHIPQIVHGELCTKSILVDDWDNPLITDYGLVKIQGVVEYPIPLQRGLRERGPSDFLRWKAPEVISCHTSGWTCIGGKHTTMSDVYAFALVCLEVYSGEPPFYYWTDVEVHSNFVKGHQIPRVPYDLKTSANQLASMREKWWARLRTCWAFNPMDRPALADMVHMLYFPASIDDPRNEAHGYTLGTDDDVYHESCENDACFWSPPFEYDSEDDYFMTEYDYFSNWSEDEDDFAMQTVIINQS